MGPRQRLFRLGLGNPDPKRAVDWEIDHHMREVIDSLVDEGWEPEEARREAERRFGNVPRHRSRMVRDERKRRVNAQWSEAIIEFFADLRLAVRSLWREWRFTSLAAGTLALGIGCSTAVFGIVNQLALRPLPGVASPGKAAYLRFASATDPVGMPPQSGLSLHTFDAVRENVGTLLGVASYGVASVHVSAEGRRPIAMRGMLVYGDFFEVLGVRPKYGRLIRAEETRLGNDPLIAVIGEDLAGRLFGNAESAPGKTIEVNGQPVEVIGVAGGGFRGPERGYDLSLWMPHGALVPLIHFPADRLESPNSVMHNDLVVRPRRDVDSSMIEEEVAGVLAGFGQDDPETREYLATLTPRIFPGLNARPGVRSRNAQTFRILWAVVALLLLIACANVANLLLFRNMKHRSDIATRRAFGASHGALARRYLLEYTLLALFAGAVGIGAAWVVTGLFRGEQFLGNPSLDGLSIDGSVALFTFAAALLATVFFGSVPAILAGRFNLLDALRGGGRTETGRFRALRSALSACQLALTLSLLVGALLLVDTLRNLYAVDTGMSVENLLGVWFEGPADLDASGLQSFQKSVLTSVKGVEGVQGAAFGSAPIGDSRTMGRADLPGTERRDGRGAEAVGVTPGWFELLRISFVDGRAFRDEDWVAGSAGKVVVTAALARHLFGQDQVVGRRINMGLGFWEEAEIVGVTRDLRYVTELDERIEAFFIPLGSMPTFLQSSSTLIVRSALVGQPAFRNQIVEAIQSLVPDKGIREPFFLPDRVDNIHADQRILGRLLTALSLLALVLSAVGLYGVLSYSVAARTREFGIRMALGAPGTVIMALASRHGALVFLGGASIGLAGAVGLSNLLGSLLFGIEPTDPVVYALGLLLLAAAAAIACFLPALAATRTSPSDALRQE